MSPLLHCAVLLAVAVCGGVRAADSPSLVWADFKDTLQSHSGATVLPLAMSDKPGDVTAEPLRVSDGQVWVVGRLTNANGGQWATLGMEVPGQAGGTPVDLSDYQNLRIRLSSATSRVLRLRLKGRDPKYLNTGCYPVMLQRVGPQPTDYVVPLGTFEPQPWCAGRGISVEQTLPAVVSVEVTANEPETEPVRYTVGRIEFLRATPPAVAAPLSSAPRVARDPRWALAWADEFNAPADQVVDTARWWIVRTHQPAQAATPREASHDGLGHLAIRLPAVDVPVSTRLQVKPAAAMMLGRVEVRFKAPERAGLSASLSLLGAPLAELPWPEAGEIVLLETQARGPATLGLYGPGLEDDAHLAQVSLSPGEASSDGFHEIAVEWEPGRIRWLLDGVLAKTQLRADLPPASRAVLGQWPFLLTIGLTAERVPGALLQGPGGADTRLLLDHVRVYQRDDQAAAVRPRLAAWHAQRSAMAAPAHGKEPQTRKRNPPAEPSGPPKPVRQVTCERNERYGLILCH